MFVYTSDTVYCCKMALSVREQCRWFELELKTTEVQSKWESVINKSDEFYSFDGRLDGALERKCNSRLIVSGPLVDVYLKELGALCSANCVGERRQEFNLVLLC